MADEDGAPVLTWRDIKARKRPTRVKHRVVLDSEAADRLEEAQFELAQAQRMLDQADTEAGKRRARTAVEDAEQALDKARSMAADASVEFVLQALSRPDYEDLQSDHPASDKQRNEAKRDNRPAPPWNLDTFPPALVQACAVNPVLSEADVADLWATWEQAELLALFYAARDACERRRVVDLGKGS